jgi:Uma2 family endonuclease
MPARTLMSVEEYLRTSFDGPDRDYVDGEVLERNVGGNSHSKVQANLVVVFSGLKNRVQLHIRPEMRLQVRPDRFRVADFAIYLGQEPEQEVPSYPPFLAVEVLSRDDRMVYIVERLKEYREFGVVNVWVVDPWTRKFYSYGANGLHEVSIFELSEFELRIEHADLFS